MAEVGAWVVEGGVWTPGGGTRIGAICACAVPAAKSPAKTIA